MGAGAVAERRHDVTDLSTQPVEEGSSRWADVTFWAGWAVGALLLLAVGSKQWFVQDDWSLIIGRETIRDQTHGLYWLFYPQDGHWLTVPAWLWHVTQDWFGITSYWPYLLPMLAAYLASVVLVRVICRRAGITPWTTTIVCVMLAMFGSGWENLVWAVQISYFLSLLAFLAHLVLVDHDGPPDWRDAIGGVIALVGVASSGFGPFFLFGVTLMLVLRRRWLAILSVVPAALAWLWWFVKYSSDNAAETHPGSRARVPEFAIAGLTETFNSLVGALPVAGIAILGCLGVLAWKRDALGPTAPTIAMAATAVALFLGVGYERVGFGVTTAGSSRYVGMAAVLLAPLFALAVDQLGRLGRPALAAGRLLLIIAVEVNAGRLWTIGSNWAKQTAADRETFELVAGSPRLAEADPRVVVITDTPDVRAGNIPGLVAAGAITPRQPATPAQVARVDKALHLPPSAGS
jgi:hypothetical protein